MAERFTVEARQDRGTAPIRPSIVDLAPDAAGWDAFVARSNPGSYLQTTAWAEVKAPNGWRPLRFIGTRPVERSGPVLEGSPADEAGSGDEDQPEEAGEEMAFGVATAGPKAQAVSVGFRVRAARADLRAVEPGHSRGFHGRAAPGPGLRPEFASRTSESSRRSS